MKPAMKTLVGPVVLCVLVVAVLAGCGSVREEPAGATVPSRAPTTAAVPTATELPPLKGPSFRLHRASGDVDLAAWTACYDHGCYDGSPPENLVDAGPTDAVELSVPHPGWTFEVTFKESSGRCPRSILGTATKVGPTRIRIEPVGNPGSWDVDVFGRGPEGDAVTTFRWHTQEAGPFPARARSHLAVLADDDGRLTTYGVELDLGDLATTPTRTSATVTVTATDGGRSTLDLGPATDEDCYSAGTVSWRAPEKAAREATRLHGTAFDYRVDLDLDGVRYVGRASWPADSNEDIAPGVPLTWSPALPVYRG